MLFGKVHRLDVVIMVFDGISAYAGFSVRAPEKRNESCSGKVVKYYIESIEIDMKGQEDPSKFKYFVTIGE